MTSPRDALWFRYIAEGCKRAEFWLVALNFVVSAFLSCLQMVRAGAAHRASLFGAMPYPTVPGWVSNPMNGICLRVQGAWALAPAFHPELPFLGFRCPHAEARRTRTLVFAPLFRRPFCPRGWRVGLAEATARRSRPLGEAASCPLCPHRWASSVT